ncbi:unnamed protein product [Urochloa humidicola]
MLVKVVCEICGSGKPAKCVQCNATARATVGDGRERTKAEARLLPDWALREKAQRTQEALAAGISGRLPDGGRRLRLWLDAFLGEISNRRLDAHGPPHPHGGNGEAPVPDNVVCEICGSGNLPHLIAQCARCNVHEHRYCMQVVAYSIPHEWHCYECQEKDNGDPKRSQVSVPLNDPHMEELEVETDPTQLQSILPAEVPMEMWEQSPMSDGDDANVGLEDPQVEAAEAEEECQDAGREKQQSSFNLNGKWKYRDGHTILKANKDEEYTVQLC